MIILSLDAWEIPIDISSCRCLEAGLAVCHNQRGYARASHPASPNLLLQIQVVTRTRGGLRQPTGEPSFLRLWSQQLGSLSGTCGGDWHLFPSLAPLLEPLQQREERRDEQHRQTGRCDDAAQYAESQRDPAGRIARRRLCLYAALTHPDWRR